MPEALDLSVFLTPAKDGVTEMGFAVEGIDCAACIGEIEGALKPLPGIVNARLNYTTQRLTVGWRAGEARPEAVLDGLERLGYRAHPFGQRAEEEEARHAQWLLRCLGVAGFAAMNIMLLSVSVWSGNVTDITPETRDFMHWLSALIALPAAAYAGQPFFRSAMRALSAGRLNMDVPITLGVLLALGMSVVETALSAEHAYFDSAVMLLFFLLAGRYLDHAMRRKTRAVAGNLAALRAEVAHRLDEAGALATVPVAALRPGDAILVRPGERIPADGTIEGGASEIDESLVTGETARRPVLPGEAVYAGSLNFDGALSLRVTAAGRGTLLDEIERLLETAGGEKSRYVRLADRAARLYAPVVHATAFLTVVGWLLAGASLHDAIITAVAVLIITCPCALALAVPAVQVVASGALFRSGVFLSAGDALERLSEIDTVVFDKTGTLTLPEPRIADPEAVPADLLALAGRLAQSSTHPLAAVLARGADRRPVAEAREEAGRGVRAMVDGVEARLGSPAFCGYPLEGAALAEPGVSLIALRWGARTALFRIEQALRPDAKAVVQALAARGLEIRIMSGDRPEAVRPVAEDLGISTWQGGLKPAEKIAALEALKAQGRRILMVGDGVNDAPALAAAHVSISPISAAQITQAQADAVFLGERLAPVQDAVEVAAQARRLMRQNLMLAVVYNFVAVPLAVLGFVTPLIAAAAMSGSSLLVTVNALRARRPAAPAGSVPAAQGGGRALPSGAPRSAKLALEGARP